MATEKIQIDIEAADKASKKLDDVADKVEEIEDAKPEVVVEAETKQAEADLSAVEKAVLELDARDVEIALEARVDDLKGQLRDAEKDLGTFKDQADQSRSVMANMVGNSAQDLGQFGGVAGTAGVAVGQLAEYAADGNIKLKNMVALGGGMAILSLAVKGISGHFERIAKAKAFEEGQVEDWADALRKGEDAAAAIADSFERAGKVEVNIGNFTGDLTEGLAAAGLSADRFAQLIEGGPEKIDQWAAAMEAAGADTQLVALITAAAASEHETLQEAQENAAAGAEVFGRSQEEIQAALDATREATQRAIESQHEWLDAQLAVADSRFAVRDAEENFAEAVAETNALLESGTATAEELEDAYRNEGAAARDAAAAAARFAEDQAKANGQTLSAEDRLDEMNKSLLESARTATPAARAEIAQYISDINGIPLSQATEIVANADTAQAEADLDALSQPRTMEVQVNMAAALARADIDIARWRQRWNSAPPLDFVGGPRSAPPQVVGPAPSSTVNVTVNAPRGMRSDDVIAAAQRYARRNGGTVIDRRGSLRRRGNSS